MRILHVYRTYFPETQGGLEEVIRQICSNSKTYGTESKVFTLTTNKVCDVILHENIEVHRFPISFEIASCGFSAEALKDKFKELTNWADVIHYHFPWPFGDMLHLYHKVKKPAVVTYHSDIIRQKWLAKIYQPIMHRFLSNMDAIVATSKNYFATSDILGKYSEKVSIIPIGIDDKSRSVKPELLNKWRQQVGNDFFLFIGVLRYYKGLHILLEALRNTKCKVVIVGSGPVEKELKAQAEQLSLSNVTFLGYVNDDDKTSLIQLSLGIVFPSYLRSEAFGVTLLEGALYGKPLISTEIGSGTSYVNNHRESGLVVPPSDPKSLRQAMEIIASDPVLAKKMGKNARARYETLFTGSLMAERYNELYRRLI